MAKQTEAKGSSCPAGVDPERWSKIQALIGRRNASLNPSALTLAEEEALLDLPPMSEFISDISRVLPRPLPDLAVKR